MVNFFQGVVNLESGFNTIQVGTLGSFYSCTGLGDTSPTLIVQLDQAIPLK